MDRLKELRKYLISRLESGELGLEVAPWHSPVLPKRDFPSVRTLDIFPQNELRERARNASPPLTNSQIAAIEPVDFVGNAADIAAVIPPELHGKFSFILSSHNFEHIPNPIRFLEDCTDLLADDGILVMAIPDKRACFDHWRSVSTLGQFIDAYAEQRKTPTLGQEIDSSLGHAFVKSDSGPSTVFYTNTPDSEIWSNESGFSGFAERLQSAAGEAKIQPAAYTDAHCWTFTPESFALLLRDLNALHLSRLFPLEISPTIGVEFIVYLSKAEVSYPSRSEMCRTFMAALGENNPGAQNNPARYRRIFAGYMLGIRLLDKLLGHR